MGGPVVFCRRPDRLDFLFPLVFVWRWMTVKKSILPFVLTFLICGAFFLTLDFSIMKLMGLSLFFNP